METMPPGKKIPKLKRVNVTLDEETLEELDVWSELRFGYQNRSRAIRVLAAEAMEKVVREGRVRG